MLICELYKVVTMSRKLKLMIVFNFLLALLFVYFSYTVWETIYEYLSLGWRDLGQVTSLSPLIMNLDTGIWGFRMNLINTPFILFWIMFSVNLYFIIRFERDKVKS